MTKSVSEMNDKEKTKASLSSIAIRSSILFLLIGLFFLGYADWFIHTGRGYIVCTRLGWIFLFLGLIALYFVEPYYDKNSSSEEVFGRLRGVDEFDLPFEWKGHVRTNLEQSLFDFGFRRIDRVAVEECQELFYHLNNGTLRVVCIIQTNVLSIPHIISGYLSKYEKLVSQLPNSVYTKVDQKKRFSHMLIVWYLVEEISTPAKILLSVAHWLDKKYVSIVPCVVGEMSHKAWYPRDAINYNNGIPMNLRACRRFRKDFMHIINVNRDDSKRTVWTELHWADILKYLREVSGVQYSSPKEVFELVLNGVSKNNDEGHE